MCMRRLKGNNFGWIENNDRLSLLPRRTFIATLPEIQLIWYNTPATHLHSPGLSQYPWLGLQSGAQIGFEQNSPFHPGSQAHSKLTLHLKVKISFRKSVSRKSPPNKTSRHSKSAQLRNTNSALFAFQSSPSFVAVLTFFFFHFRFFVFFQFYVQFAFCTLYWRAEISLPKAFRSDCQINGYVNREIVFSAW